MFVAVWDFWIKGSAVPIFQMCVFSVFGISHDLKELLIPWEAANIFGRASA